ncbi:hypothetical protein B0H21DRAFT_169335 [Amylocystis lapponica]|nr:hypothetical protein B0H21DRAFT_169335 [Amylocystis lapponica]
MRFDVHTFAMASIGAGLVAQVASATGVPDAAWMQERLFVECANDPPLEAQGTPCARLSSALFGPPKNAAEPPHCMAHPANRRGFAETRVEQLQVDAGFAAAVEGGSEHAAPAVSLAHQHTHPPIKGVNGDTVGIGLAVMLCMIFTCGTGILAYTGCALVLGLVGDIKRHAAALLISIRAWTRSPRHIYLEDDAVDAIYLATPMDSELPMFYVDEPLVEDEKVGLILAPWL